MGGSVMRSFPWFRSVTQASLIAVVLAVPAVAQVQDSMPRRSRCPGRPAWACHPWFFHTGLAVSLGTLSLQGDALPSRDEPLTMELGFLLHPADRGAFGASVSWWGFPQGHGGGAIRYRRWIQPEVALHLATGVDFVTFRDFAPEEWTFRPVVQSSVMYRDLAGITLRARFVRGDGPDCQSCTTGIQWEAGAHMGGPFAPVVAFLAVVATGLIVGFSFD